MAFGTALFSGNTEQGASTALRLNDEHPATQSVPTLDSPTI
jgi:hypothetical protein